jgi:DNA-binding GntR family transcriptional regulator
MQDTMNPKGSGVKPLVIDHASLTERVAEQLRDAIRAGELTPGTLYSVVELAQELGVSRTPVREALLQLASNGMVRFERSRGVRILELSTKDIEEIYMLRLYLEAPAAFQAATSMSPEHRQTFTKAFAGMRAACDDGDERAFQRHDVVFHESVLRGAGNSRVMEAVAKVRSQMHSLGLSTTRTRTLADILAVHETIYDAVLARDAHAAAAAVQDHLLGTLRMLIQQSTGSADADDYQPPVLPRYGR